MGLKTIPLFTPTIPERGVGGEWAATLGVGDVVADGRTASGASGRDGRRGRQEQRKAGDGRHDRAGERSTSRRCLH